FPPLWSEWNGKYRDTVRDYWRGTDQTLPEFANRLTGSSDLYALNGRRPYASINFITAHDGYTLHDLPEVKVMPERQQRNFLTTLMTSVGVPMLLGGDEIGRTQNGNANAYD